MTIESVAVPEDVVVLQPDVMARPVEPGLRPNRGVARAFIDDTEQKLSGLKELRDSMALIADFYDSGACPQYDVNMVADVVNAYVKWKQKNP